MLRDKIIETEAKLKCTLWRSRILEANELPNFFLLSLYIYFLFQNLCLDLVSTEFITQLNSKPSLNNNPIKTLVFFVVGVYDLDAKQHQTLYSVIAILFCVYLLLLLVFFFYLLITIMCRREVSEFSRKMFSYAKNAHIYFFSLPMNNYLYKLVFRSVKDDITGSETPIVIGAGIILVFSLMINFVGILSDISFLNGSILQRSNNFMYWYMFTHMSISGLYFGFLMGNLSEKINQVFIIFDFVFALFGVIGYIYFVPFLSKKIEYVSISYFSLKLSISGANLVVLDLLSEDNFNYLSLFLFVLIFFILVLKLTKICISDERPTQILDPKTLFLNNDFWFMRKISRFFSLIKSSDHILDRAKNFYSIEKLLVCSNQEHYALKDNFPELSESFGKELLHLADKKFQNSDLKMGIIEILMEKNTNFFEVYSLIEKMSKIEKNPIKAVGFYILKKRIEGKNFKTENDSNDSKLMKKYFEAMTSQEKLSRMIQKFSVHQAKLYKMLQLHNPDLLEISHTVSVLLHHQKQIQDYYNSLPAINQNINPEILKLYAEFIRLFDEIVYKNHIVTYKMNKAKLYSKDHRNFFDSNIDVNPKTMHMLLSLDPHDFGKILCFSETLSALLKQSNESTKGKNIKNLLSFSLQDLLETKIKNLSSHLQENQKIEPQTLLLLTSEGYLKAFREYSQILSVEQKGLCQLSILEYHKEGPEYLLVDRAGLIESYTKIISDDLYLDKSTRLNLKSLNQKAASQFDCFVKETTKDNKFYIRIPSNDVLVYRCEIIKSGIFGVFFIQAEKHKIKNIDPAEIYFEEKEEVSNYDIAHEFLDKEFKMLPTGSSTNMQPISHCQVKEEKKIATQVTQIFTQHSDDLKSSSDETRVNSSLHQSSVNSSQSYLEHKKIELKETLDSLKFYKFSEKYIPIISVFIFVGVYLFVIMYAYSSSSRVMDNVNKRIDLYNQVSLRVRATLEVCRSAVVNKAFQDVFPNGYSSQVNNWRIMQSRITAINLYNSNVRISLGETDDDEIQTRFYEKKVRIFYDDFADIDKTDKFYMENTFTATNMLTNQAGILYNYAFIKGDYQTYIQQYIMTNAFNDLLIENENLLNFLMDNIYDKIDQMSEQEIQFLILTIILLFCCIFSTVGVLFISYRKTNNYLTTFVDPSNSFLADFMKSLNHKHVKRDFMKVKQKSGSKRNDLRSYKSPHAKKLLASFLLKIVSIFFILIVPLILLLKNHATIVNTDNRIKVTMSDVNKFNIIKIYSYYAVILQTEVFSFYEGFSLKIPNKENFPIIIQKLSQIISIQENFSDEAMSYLREDTCKYYSYHPLRPDCTKIANGILHGGIIQSMLAVQAYTSNLQQSLKAVNGNASLLTDFATDPRLVDTFFIVSNAINPAIEYFQALMISNLGSNLRNISNDILMLFVAGVLIGVLIMIVVLYTIWYVVGGDRKKNVQLMRLVPQEYLVRNREVKSYLIRQSYEATKYLKSIEKKMIQAE